MEKVILEIHEDVVSALEKVKAAKNGEVELVVPEGSVLFENILNLKLLRREAEELKKPLLFSTTDRAGQSLIDSLEGGEGSSSTDFVSREVSIDSVLGEKETRVKKTKWPVSLPKISFAFLKRVKLPRFSFGSKKTVLMGSIFLLALIGYGGYQAWWRVPKAKIKIVVNSQPLIKSVEIQVIPGAENNVEKKILAGVTIDSAIIDSEVGETTGEKIVGERATGKIKIVNRTTTEKTFQDGEEVYSTDDDDFFYTFVDDVTVPGATLQDPLDINSPLIPGSAEVNVIAVDIGEDYNLNEGESMEFDEYNSNEYVAEVAEDIDGGSSEIVNVVVQADLDKLSESLFTKIEEKGSGVVAEALSSDQTLINGSVAASLVTEEFSAEVGDEADEVTVTQTVNFQGLAYNADDLDAILDDLLKGFVPSGFELSSEERETNVEILGNTDATVLNLSQADLQVTIKSFVIPEIDEKELKEKLVGASMGEAEKILGKVRNVKNYEVEVDPNIPLLRKLPGNIENISLEVKRE